MGAISVKLRILGGFGRLFVKLAIDEGSNPLLFPEKNTLLMNEPGVIYGF